MARVEVRRATMSGEQVSKLAVKMHGLPERVIDRDTALAWLKDGHSFVAPGAVALQLVEHGEEEVAWSIRTDNEATAADSLPELPAV